MSHYRDFLANIHRIPLAAILFSGLLVGMATSGVQAQTDTFNVTTSVGEACSVSATDLGYGAYDPLSATDNDATTSMNVTCTLTTTYDVGLDAGTGTGATTTVRIMEFGANTLNYALYQDAGRTTIWGENVGVDTVSGTGTGSAQALTIYGRIPALQSVTPGAYSDLITVTVTF